MRISFPAIALLLSLTAAPATAGQETDADSERLSQDLITAVDSWLGRINNAQQPDKQVSPVDFDSIFDDSFFSGSDDPIRDIELVQKKMNLKLGPKQKDFDASYGKWVADKMSPADLSPEVSSDRKHITVNLMNPPAESGSLKVKTDTKRIKIDYLREEKRQVTNPDGSISTSSVMKRKQCVMAVPKDADPAKYKVRVSKGSASIIFDRLKKARRTEVSK
ncbi:MAG: hypothetical protein Q7R35_13340 [Elusimicrobiota bacterium]|nr:hypothetical protein [Elusimicrobiota bacterium]